MTSSSNFASSFVELDRRGPHIKRLLQTPAFSTGSARISTDILVQKQQQRDEWSINNLPSDITGRRIVYFPQVGSAEKATPVVFSRSLKIG
jgi:hypothetical protein